MKHTTHNLSNEQKEHLLEQHKDLIRMIHLFGDMMLRKQIKNLYILLHPETDLVTIEFAIAELIKYGLLLQVKIQKCSHTQLLYLNKFARSIFYDKEHSGDVPALTFSNQKLFTQIFKMDYIIEKIIPDMRAQNFNIDMDNVITYLNWKGSNLLLNFNQANNYDLYQRLYLAFQDAGYTLSYDFIRDMNIAKYELAKFQSKQLKQDGIVPDCKEKEQRDMEKASYNSEVERNKYFYNLNMAGHGFIFEGIKGNIIYLAFFDDMNTIQTKKLYQNLGYILLMFQRYLNSNDIKLEVTLYTWDKERCGFLANEEKKQAYDFYLQEMVEENKKHKILKDIGILPSNWENVNTTYRSMDIYEKYNLKPDA